MTVEDLHVTPDGLFVLVILAYDNKTATPLKIHLQPWANATTHLLDDAHHSYTLLQASGVSDTAGCTGLACA